MAFTQATAEWILFRFEPLVDTSPLLDYLEAAWAQVVDFRYGWLPELGDEWSGAVRGPIRYAIEKVIYCIQVSRDYVDPSWRALWISRIAEHVLPDPTPYLSWQQWVMASLVRLYPLVPEDPLGEVVPRAAVDPNVAFRPEKTETLVNQFLSTLDHQSNRFLYAPQRMVEQGFEGEPYSFDIERDRRFRNTW